MRENIVSLGETKSYGQMMREAGYTQSTSEQPEKMITEALMAEVEDELTLIRKVKRQAIRNITEIKLKKTDARSLSTIIANLDKVDLSHMARGQMEKNKKISISIDL
jgi:hypothetical protein